MTNRVAWKVTYDVTYLRSYKGKSRNWPYRGYVTRRVYKTVMAHTAREAESIVLGLKHYLGKDIELCGAKKITVRRKTKKAVLMSTPSPTPPARRPARPARSRGTSRA